MITQDDLNKLRSDVEYRKQCGLDVGAISLDVDVEGEVDCVEVCEVPGNWVYDEYNHWFEVDLSNHPAIEQLWFESFVASDPREPSCDACLGQ